MTIVFLLKDITILIDMTIVKLYIGSIKIYFTKVTIVNMYKQVLYSKVKLNVMKLGKKYMCISKKVYM